MKIDRDKLLLSLFQEDININNKHTSITQVCLLTIKSLIPSNKRVGNLVDYRRFNEEIKLWNYYKVGNFSSLENIVTNCTSEDYYHNLDESVYSRVLPIIVSNSNFEVIEEEIIKNVLFTSGNIGVLLETLLVSRFIYSNLSKNLDIMKDLKEYTISMAQNDFIESYGELYRIDRDAYNGSFKIDFEKEKIQLISLLNGIPTSRYLYIQDLIVLLENKDSKLEDMNTIMGRIIFNASDLSSESLNLHKFYINMNDYVLRLYKSRISPENLIIRDYVLPDIFSYNEGEEFFHSLLNNCKVIKKEVRENTLTSLISTKTGTYVFNKNPI